MSICKPEPPKIKFAEQGDAIEITKLRLPMQIDLEKCRVLTTNNTLPITTLLYVRYKQRRKEKMDKAIKEIQKLLEEKKLAIAATSEASIIIRDMDTGEERVYKDLGYPI